MILHKCNINVILILVTSCEAYDKFNLEPETTVQWLSVYRLLRNSQTVILDVEADSNADLNNFLKSTHHAHSVFIISGKEMPRVIIGDKPEQILQRRLNIVLTIKYIDSSLLDSESLKFMLHSQWSVLLISVMTKDSRYKCDQGNVTEEAYNHIEVYMNDLWQKYRIMFVILMLPYTCPNHFIIYHDDSKPTNDGVYNRTIKLINTTADISYHFTTKLTRNYPLKGNIFFRFPTSITNCSGTEVYVRTSDMLSGGYCGMDGLVMSDVVRHFGFNLTLPFLDVNKYGYKKENGDITGSLGYVVRGDLDISFNSRFMVPYLDGHSYKFLNHISNDALCAVMKRPAEQPLWLYPYGGYSVNKMVILFSLFTAVGIFMWITAKIESKIHNGNHFPLFFYVRNAIIAGMFGFFLAKRNDLFIYRRLCLFASIVLLAIYQSYINYWFTTRWYDYMTMLSDLVDHDTVIQTSPSISALLKIPINDVQATLRSRTISTVGVDSFEYVVKHHNTATLERHTDAIMYALMQYMGEDGKPKLYVVDQCLRSFYLSYITNHNFPFRPQLNIFMMRLVESGLPDMYYAWTSRSLGLDTALPNMASEPRPAEKISLGAQILAFSLLLTGYFFSTLVLAIELRLDRRIRPLPFIP